MLLSPPYWNGEVLIQSTNLVKPIVPMTPGVRFAPGDPSPAPISKWGSECGRGFVRNERFGQGQVIPGTNRNKTRKVYAKLKR